MPKSIVPVCACFVFALTTFTHPRAAAASQRTEGAATAAVPAPALAGTWKSAAEELPLTSSFDQSVWGANAKSVRTVELRIQPSREATLTINKKVVDARGRTVPASASVEEAKLVIGESHNGIATRIEHDVKVVSAVRTYPDDPGYKWDLAGLRVQVVTFTDGDGNTLEVRVDTPEGQGSFWETLRRDGRAERRPAQRSSARTGPTSSES
jgi:hypothetical protein